MVTKDYVPLAQRIHTTDVIISQYENTLSKKISSKVLSASKTGIPAIFTDEETAYLTKKATDEDPKSEIDIDTSAPDLTLKKGNTEINIKHAALLVKKMEEKFPTAPSRDGVDTVSRQPYIQYGTEYGLESVPQKEIKTVNKNAYEIRTEVLSMALDWVRWQTERNIDIAEQTNRESHLQTNQLPNSDKVLDIAKKFYSFVENRKY